MEHTGPERRIAERRKMTSGFNGITPETFRGIDDLEDKINILFDITYGIHGRLSNECPARLEECNHRFKQIEKRKWWNPAAAGVGGIIGGFVAIVTKWLVMDGK